MDWLVLQTEDGWMVQRYEALPFRRSLRPRHFLTFAHAIEYGLCMISANCPGRLVLVEKDGCRTLYCSDKSSQLVVQRDCGSECLI